ncbi:MAG: chromosome segregation protein SMC, partial [Pyrinomonadaceae bacterium]
RTRQRAAEIRLESAKTNLRRISDIVSEVDKQAASLRRQASRTRRYKEIGQILRELLGHVLSAEGREFSGSLAELGEKLAEATMEENRLSEAVRKQSVASQTATGKARQAEDLLAEIRQSASENALRRERIARDFAHQTEQVADLKERAGGLAREIKTLNEQLAVISTDRERIREKNQQQTSANESEALVLLAAEESYQKQLAAVRQIEAEIEKNRRELFRHTTASERFREIAKQQANTLEKLAERAAGLEKEGARAVATHKERQNEFETEQVKIAAARRNLLTVNENSQSYLETVKSLRDNLQTLEKRLSKSRDESNTIKARRDALEKLDNQNALLEPAVQKLFAEHHKIGVKLHGTLADFLQVEAKYEKAVEAVLGANLQTVLVENKEDVRKISEWLKISKTGKLNLLVSESEPGAAIGNSINNQNPLDTAHGSDSSIKISNIIGSAVNFSILLPLDFRIVETFDEAAGFNHENCVTLAGEIVYQNRFFAFGHSQLNEKGGILGFKRELRELAARAKVLKNEFEKVETEVENAGEKLAATEQKVAELQTKIVSAERDLMSLEVNAKSLQQEIERVERHKRVVEDERLRLETERVDLEAKQLKTEADQQTAEDELRKTDAVLSGISSTLAQAREKAESANQILSEHRAAAAAANERRRSLVNALRRVEQEHAELTNRIENRGKDLSISTARLEQLSKSLTELKTQTLQVDDEKEQEAEIIAGAIKELASARGLADKHSVELGEANAAAARAKDVRAALEVSQAETSVKLQNLFDICHQELNQNLPDLPPATADFNLPEGRRKVAELREKLEIFGAVNLLALEELSEAEERLLFLTSQRKDIIDGIAAAENALDEIKRRSRERFEHAFNEINRNFTRLFSEIFGGGRGEMSLLDAADVLESGIEIVAQPPGKRLQNLLLLSGGEKALTAIALVLAIFRFRPAPFCLLDEVDAPLDEANVGRFVEKVREMSEKIQFIVITHNKRTMEAARALYGVTMEEAGISKIVSVKFE